MEVEEAVVHGVFCLRRFVCNSRLLKLSNRLPSAEEKGEADRGGGGGGARRARRCGRGSGVERHHGEEEKEEAGEKGPSFPAMALDRSSPAKVSACLVR